MKQRDGLPGLEYRDSIEYQYGSEHRDGIERIHSVTT